MGELRVPIVHWVAVKPGYQNLGLGKAIVFKGVEKSIAVEGDCDIYLHTQTWSYEAIGIYLKAGFEIMKEGSFGNGKNDYKEALPYLKEKMKGFCSFE